MAALLVLEGMIRPEYLKPYWRPFAAPAPHPADTGELRSGRKRGGSADGRKRMGM